MTRTQGSYDPAGTAQHQVSPIPAPAGEPNPGARRARPRSPADEEAYLRSVLEQARIDIAAGW